jgi:hypothetical protein
MPSISAIGDESINMKHARVFNISLHSNYGALHYPSEHIDDEQMTPIDIANMLRNRMRELSNGNTHLMNGFVVDPSPTMESSIEVMRTFPRELRHNFCISCDSQGFQLLVKSIVAIPCFKPIFEKAQIVITSFQTSPLQLTRLRSIQKADIQWT